MYGLRDTNENDIYKLKKYKLASIMDYANDISDDEKNEIISYVNDNIEKEFKNFKIVVYDSLDIGCLLFYSYKDGYLVDEIYLDDEYRGKGIGSRILNDLIDEYNHLYLWVYKDNKNAIKLYKKLGFQVKDETDYRLFMECVKN